MNAPASPRPLRYHLRFQVLPGPGTARDAGVLAEFCRDHGIEEVVLIFAAEEWNNGLLSRTEENRWFRAVRATKEILEQAGVAASLNPWMTCLHGARGRTFPKDCRFIPMVSPTGEVSKACASFADAAFQDDLCRLYARFARLGFRVLWIEDDFRFHNHGPLDWGGGFEEPVLERFRARIGKPASREDVVAALLKPGKPHPWRTVWQSVWRDIHLEIAGKLAAAVTNASKGRSTLGLMSSGPAAHSLEGRDWAALFNAMSIQGRAAHRPHFGPYSEAPGRSKVHSIQMLDLQKTFRTPAVEVAPEIENFPFTSWNKSDPQTWSEMALCQLHGSDALLLNLFPLSGNPVDEEPGPGRMLDRSRPGLAWLAEHFPRDLETRGVGVPYKTDAAARLCLPPGKPSLGSYGLASPFEAGQYLMQNGIPVASRPQAVNAVFGPLAWAFSDSELRAFLAGGVLLDAVAAEILLARGFGDLIGLKGIFWAGREEDTYAIEETLDQACGVRPGFYLNANLGERMARLAPARGTATWTRILRPDKSTFGAGWYTFKNSLGGRVAVCAAPNPASLTAHDARQTIAQNLVRFLANGRFESPMVTGAPHLLPMHFGTGKDERVAILNGSTDPAEPLLAWPGSEPAMMKWWTLAPLQKPARGTRPVPYLGLRIGLA